MVRAALLGLLLSGSTAAAQPITDERQGTLIQIARDGSFTPLGDAAVTLRCVPTPESNPQRRACSASLRVRVADKLVARADDVARLEWEMVAGNGGKIELDLLPVDGEAALVIVRVTTSVGDQWMELTSSEQLFVVRGRKLEEVVSHRAEQARDPGPDESEDDKKSDKRWVLSVDRLRTRRVPNLIETAIVDGNEDVSEVLAWDGLRYQPCPSCAASPETLIDGATHRSYAPLVDKVLSGRKLAADELAGLGPAARAVLRNAPYARHGRAFKKPELQAIFYGSNSKLKTSLVVDPNYSDKLLDAVDAANLSLVSAAEKRAQ